MADNTEMENNINTDKQDDTGTNGEMTQPEKTFTQAEVNEIIKKRLAREKSTADEEYNQKLAAVEQRELTLKLREELINNDMPKELADIIKIDKDEDVDNAVDMLKRYISRKEPEKKMTGFKIGATSTFSDEAAEKKEQVDPYREVMGLNRR